MAKRGRPKKAVTKKPTPLDRQLGVLVPGAHKTWQGLATALGLHTSTISKYRDGTILPSRQILLEFAGIEAAEKELVNTVGDELVNDDAVSRCAKKWLELAVPPEPLAISDQDLQILRKRAGKHLIERQFTPADRNLMDICGKTQNLARERTTGFLNTHSEARNTIVLAFMWLWKGGETLDYLHITETQQFVTQMLRAYPSLQIWAFFAINGHGSEHKRDQAQTELVQVIKAWQNDMPSSVHETKHESRADTRRTQHENHPAADLAGIYSDRFQCWVGCQDTYRHLGDHWLLLPPNKLEAQAHLVSADPSLLYAVTHSGVPELKDKPWEHCAQVLQLHADQISAAIDEFGIEPRLTNEPPWYVRDDNPFHWKRLEFKA